MHDETRTFVSTVLPRLHAAELGFRNGDPEPRLALWTQEAPASWLGQYGTVATGPQAVRDHFPWVAGRLRDVVDFRSDLVIADAWGDAAYTVQLEYTLGTFDGRPDTTMVHRVSRVYRREQGGWRIAHGHGDAAPWASRPPRTTE